MGKERSLRMTPVLILLACIALTTTLSTNSWAALGTGPWPMFRHDLRHTSLSPNNGTPGGSFWKYNTGNGYGGCAIGSDGTIYVNGSSYFYALNSNGTLKWRVSVGGSSRSTPAVGSDGVIYIGGGNNRLYAINSNGTVKWSFLTGNTISASPAIAADNTIYIGSRDGKLYAINPTNGTQKWALTLGDMHMASPAVASDGTIYVGTSSTKLYAVYPSGTKKWEYATGDNILSTPSISSDEQTIYVGSNDGYLYAVKSDGTLRWRFLAGFRNGSTTSSPAIGPTGNIYIGSNYGSIYALSPAGAELWHYETNNDIRSSPAVSADGTLYVCCWGGYLYALNPDGTEKWHFLAPGFFASPAIAGDGSIVVPGTNGYVYGDLTTTPPTANPPSGLTATALSETQVRLNWVDNSSDEYGFRIERKTGTTGSFVFVANAGAGVVTYTDSTTSSGQFYTYRVCAYQEGGNSAFSNEASVTTPGIPVPTGVIATPISETRIDVSWTDCSTGELGFKIERMTGPNGEFQQIGAVGANVQSYSDFSVNPATNYYYRVRTFDATRVSSPSNEDWALTPGKDFTNVINGNTTRKWMALTFDAGTANIRQNLLNLLRDRGVICTFFITGLVAQSQPTLVQQIGHDGHHIGNHTYDHPDLTDCTESQIAWQFQYTDDILYGLTGHHTQSYFRAPYGTTNSYVLTQAALDGYRHIYWTQDCGDASWNADTQEIIDRTMAAASNGCIMLYHCTVAATEAAMPTILDNLTAQGYKLVTVPEILAPTVATSPEGMINAGWNLISVPIEPATPTPMVVFRGLNISGHLYKWNKETASLTGYDSFDPEAFGIVSPDEGYWFYTDTPTTITCAGSEATADRHIKLPQAIADPVGAWTIIGYPYQTAQEYSNCSVYNPNVAEPRTVPLMQAIDAGWVSNVAWAWDSTTQSLVDVGPSDLFPSWTQLEPWRGYWMQSNVAGLELIVPAP